MIYVFEGGSIVYDGTTINENEKNKAVVIERLPEPEKREGKIAILRANKKEERVYYEYVDEPKNAELEELKQVVADLTELVLLGGDM